MIVYVGCGERGNEMADVLDELSALAGSAHGRSRCSTGRCWSRTPRTCRCSRARRASTRARRSPSSTATWATDVGLIADSTSRWAEALREVASRTGELPAEEGYPAGLASALAAFYERAGRVRTLGGADASITILGAVSPPGGDMTEPVSAHTRRFVRCTWSLDPDLAYARHYPAVSWRDSSSRDAEAVGAWHARHGDPVWASGATGRSGCSPTPTARVHRGARRRGSLPEPERLVLLARRGSFARASCSRAA